MELLKRREYQLNLTAFSVRNLSLVVELQKYKLRPAGMAKDKLAGFYKTVTPNRDILIHNKCYFIKMPFCSSGESLFKQGYCPFVVDISSVTKYYLQFISIYPYRARLALIGAVPSEVCII